MEKILVFIYDEMADFEITFAAQLLGGDMGKEIIPIAYENKIITGKSGLKYQPAGLVKEFVREENVEALIIPGGLNGEIRPELMELIKTLDSKNKLLAAICAAPRFLAKAGILDKVKYTTSIATWTDFHAEKFGETDPFPRNNYTQKRVVRDDNVITAVGNAFVDFAAEVADYFKAFEDEDDKKGFLGSIKG